MDEKEAWRRGFTAIKIQHEGNKHLWKFAYADHIPHWKCFPKHFQRKSFGYAHSIGPTTIVSGKLPKSVKNLARTLNMTAKLTTSKFNQWQLREHFDVEKTVFKIMGINATSNGFFDAHYFCKPLNGDIKMNHQTAEEIIEFVTKNRKRFPPLDIYNLKRANEFGWLEYKRINSPHEYSNIVAQLSVFDIDYLKTYQPDDYAHARTYVRL